MDSSESEIWPPKGQWFLNPCERDTKCPSSIAVCPGMISCNFDENDWPMIISMVFRGVRVNFRNLNLH
jgi:hypothetical protein